MNTSKTPLRLVFMGTPPFAATIFRHIHTWTKKQGLAVDLIAAYCQPDRPSGRGKSIKPCAVKEAANELGVPVYQPINFREEADVKILSDLKPDLLLVAAYGLLLPQKVLDIPSLGPFNVHASLLPKYRGAAPIQRAIMQGENTTGITIMRMEAGLDTGPMLLQKALVIGKDDTSGTLHEELADLGAELLLEFLDLTMNKAMPPSIVQDDSKATHAAKLTKADGFIDFSQKGSAVHAQMRGVLPWPGAQAVLHLEGRAPLPVKLELGTFFASHTLNDAPLAEALPFNEEELQEKACGSLLGLYKDALAFKVLDGLYLIKRLRPSGKGEMSAADFARGYGAFGFAEVLQSEG